MPIVDGLEVCQQLRLMRKWRSIPIIMVTANVEKAVLAKCLAAGADDFINKPVDGLELCALAQSRFWHREDDLSIELENAKIAVTEQHCEWVVKELLDNAFKSSDLGVPVEIRGRVIDRRYYLWVSDRTDDSIDDQELVIGLKIVKKIVNIYDGEFAKTTVDENRMIYVTFPLAQTKNWCTSYGLERRESISLSVRI
jgi:CheY-like chemotaxis protein